MGLAEASYLVGIAAAVVLVVGLIGPIRRAVRRAGAARTETPKVDTPTTESAASAPGTHPGPGYDDFGLLAVVSVTASPGAAEDMRRRLAANGIRSTLSARADGRTRVLVFAEHAPRARRLVGGARDSTAD